MEDGFGEFVVVGLGEDDVLAGNWAGPGDEAMRVDHSQVGAPLAVLAYDGTHWDVACREFGFEEIVEIKVITE
jgi:hypothetical protein